MGFLQYRGEEDTYQSSVGKKAGGVFRVRAYARIGTSVGKEPYKPVSCFGREVLPKLERSASAS